jgi:hypothetical protein
MKKYNTEAKNKDTSEIVRFLIQNNTELRSVMEDTRTSPPSLRSTNSGVDFEADASIRIAKVLQTVNVSALTPQTMNLNIKRERMKQRDTQTICPEGFTTYKGEGAHTHLCLT